MILFKAVAVKKGKYQSFGKSLNTQNKSEQKFFPTKHSNEKNEGILYTVNDYINMYDIYVIILCTVIIYNYL